MWPLIIWIKLAIQSVFIVLIRWEIYNMSSYVTHCMRCVSSRMPQPSHTLHIFCAFLTVANCSTCICDDIIAFMRHTGGVYFRRVLKAADHIANRSNKTCFCRRSDSVVICDLLHVSLQRFTIKWCLWITVRGHLQLVTCIVYWDSIN